MRVLDWSSLHYMVRIIMILNEAREQRILIFGKVLVSFCNNHSFRQQSSTTGGTAFKIFNQLVRIIYEPNYKFI